MAAVLPLSRKFFQGIVQCVSGGYSDCSGAIEVKNCVCPGLETAMFTVLEEEKSALAVEKREFTDSSRISGVVVGSGGASDFLEIGKSTIGTDIEVLRGGECSYFPVAA